MRQGLQRHCAGPGVKRAGAAGHAASHATDVQSGSGAETESVPLFIAPG